jgi:hypothetical protein
MTSDVPVIWVELEAEYFRSGAGHDFADLPGGLFCRSSLHQFVIE